MQARYGLLVAAGVSLLTGCAGDRNSALTGTVGRAGPPPDMAGRWTFSAAGGRACAMNIGAPQGAEGTIRPEGGCPGTFFTSRKWTFEGETLILRDHNGQALAQLRTAGGGRFEGQSPSGEAVTLTR
jgi:hypothetical protein